MYRGHAHDLGEGKRGASIRCLAKWHVWSLKPCLLIGPHNITQRQKGGPEAEGGAIDRRYNGFPELDECVDEGSEKEHVDLSTSCHWGIHRDCELSGHHLMLSAIFILSFFLSSVSRLIKDKKSSPQQKIPPTAASSTNLLSSDAAVAIALWISFMTWGQSTEHMGWGRSQDGLTRGCGQCLIVWMVCWGCGLTSGLSVLFSELLVDNRMWVNPSCFFTTMSRYRYALSVCLTLNRRRLSKADLSSRRLFPVTLDMEFPVRLQ